jgi:hypothetical protein
LFASVKKGLRNADSQRVNSESWAEREPDIEKRGQFQQAAQLREAIVLTLEAVD